MNLVLFVTLGLAVCLPAAWGFVPSAFQTEFGRSSSVALSVSNDENSLQDGSSNDSRRGFVKKVVGGLAVTGIVANGFAVQGPSPVALAPGSLKGQVIVITGGNTGLGLESAKRLAAAGATIVMTSRNLTKGARAVQIVQEYVNSQNGDNNAKVYAAPLDLCDMESVKAFPAAIKQILPTGTTIDVLMNNAGVMAIPELEITKDGFEKTFQTNHLGHFGLTALMMPLLSQGAKVINVASAAHMIVAKTGLDMDNLNGEKGYAPWTAYGMSKLENVLFTQELQRRADAAGIKLTATSLHPGAVRTDLPRYIVGEDKFGSMLDDAPPPSFNPALYLGLYFTKNVQRGANSQIWLAAGANGEDTKGKYYQNLKEVKLLSFAKDSEKAKQLWDVSEKLSGIKFNI